MLSKRFTALTISLGAANTTAHHWSSAFTERYTEPQRHYHTLSHVRSMLDCLDECRSLIHDETAVTLAIFFHDWIYDPRGKDNEIESVNVFKEFAESVDLDERMREKVVGFIERTITHTLPGVEEDGDAGLFLDFDLEVLSRSRVEYKVYVQQIRREYGHYEDSEYRKGRAKVLRSFLSRERLYFSEKFYTEREEASKQNLRAEIASLEEL